MKTYIHEDAQTPHQLLCCQYPNGLGICGCTCHLKSIGSPVTPPPDVEANESVEARESWIESMIVEVMEDYVSTIEGTHGMEYGERVTRRRACFEKLVEFIQNLQTTYRTQLIQEDIARMEKMQNGLETVNCYGNCNPRCHDSGKDIALSELITYKKDQLTK